MTMPLMKPPRKNPVLRTQQMNLPPWAASNCRCARTAATCNIRRARPATTACRHA